MYLVLLIQVFSISIPLLQVSAKPSFDYDDIEQCRAEVFAKTDTFDWKAGSKYLVYSKQKTGHEWTLPERNGNLNHYRASCEAVGLSMVTAHNRLDWQTLEEYALAMYETPLYKKMYNRVGGVFWISSQMPMIITGMAVNANPSKGRLGLTIPDEPNVAPFIVWTGYRVKVNEDVDLGLSVSKGPDGDIIRRLASSTSDHFAGLHGTWGFDMNIYPRMCMYPANSRCFKASIEEQGTTEELFKDTMFKLTDAFQGEWYMATSMKNREDAERACESVGSQLLDKDLTELPRTKDKTYEWDLNELYEKYYDALRNKLKLHPHGGFHGKAGLEYGFGYTRPNLIPGKKEHVYVSDIPPRVEIRDMPYSRESFCLCYKHVEEFVTTTEPPVEEVQPVAAEPIAVEVQHVEVTAEPIVGKFEGGLNSMDFKAEPIEGGAVETQGGAVETEGDGDVGFSWR